MTKLGDIQAAGPAASSIAEMSLSAVIIRCGCGKPNAHQGKPCPKPRRFEDRGELAYWHQSILRRSARRLARLFKHPRKD